MISFEPLLKYPTVFLSALAMALLVTRWWGPRAIGWKFVDYPGGRKQHTSITPVAGGIAIFIAFHIACAVVFLFPWKPFVGQIPVSWWLRFLPLSTAVVMVGLWDDRYGARPIIKLVLQVAIAVAAYALDIRIQNILGASLPGYADFIMTVMWFVLMMNAFNLIDGIDGLAAGIAIIASLGIAVSLVFREEPGDVLLLIGFAGACVGFLRYNFYPAKVFLGDTGSLFIGFSLAALAISTNSKGPAVAAMGMPLLAVGVPLFDTLLAIWRRSIRSILHPNPDNGTMLGIDQADREHVHHRLLERTGNDTHVAVWLYGATMVLTLVGIAISVFNDRAIGILALAFLVGAYTVVRHLAWIELRDSGEAVLKGVMRPVRRNQTLIAYVIYDLLVLNGVLLAGLWGLAAVQGGTLDLKAEWLRLAPLDVGAPFLMLVFFRAYSRVWYLARISEYVATGSAVMLGYALACGVQWTLAGADHVAFWLVRYALLAGLAAPGVVAARAALRVIQDLLYDTVRPRTRADKQMERTLICGADYQTTLFMRLLMTDATRQPPLRIVGLIDADSAKRGHYVHGCPVLGDINELPRIIRDQDIQRLYVVEQMDESRLHRVQQIAEKSGIPCYQWRIEEEQLSGGTATETNQQP